MRPTPISEPKATPSARVPILGLGFRPFFLSAAAAAVVLMAFWLALYAGGLEADTYYGGVAWHGHEMVFGYAAAVIAGFLLTAVRNWTGVRTARGPVLGALVGLWLAGRLTPLAGGVVPPVLIAIVDLAFLPALALAIVVPIFRAGQAGNMPFPLILVALAGANALTHPGLGFGGEWQARGLWFGVGLISMVITVMGGRVIPFFIERAVPGAQTRSSQWLDRASVGSVAAVAVSWLLFPDSMATGLVAAAAGLINALRLAGWHHRGLWREPLLWVLYLGYGWLVAGLLLQGVAALGLVSPFIALHGLTAGAIGVLTLGMMPRVSLGHTGRKMRAPAGLPLAFVLINGAALARTAGPLLAPGLYGEWVVGAGVLWIAAFGIFLFRYTPILTRPRIDGQPDQ